MRHRPHIMMGHEHLKVPRPYLAPPPHLIIEIIEQVVPKQEVDKHSLQLWRWVW